MFPRPPPPLAPRWARARAPAIGRSRAHRTDSTTCRHNPRLCHTARSPLVLRSAPTACVTQRAHCLCHTQLPLLVPSRARAHRLCHAARPPLESRSAPTACATRSAHHARGPGWSPMGAAVGIQSQHPPIAPHDPPLNTYPAPASHPFQRGVCSAAARLLEPPLRILPASASTRGANPTPPIVFQSMLPILSPYIPTMHYHYALPP